MSTRSLPPTAQGSPEPEGSSTSSNRALATSAAVMASGTLVSRVLGLLRNALLVAVIGMVAFGGQSGSMSDAWSVANKLPNIISMLLAGGVLNAVLVPQVVRAMKRRDGGEEYVNRLLTLAITILAGITVLLTAAATLLITLYAAQFQPEWKAVAVGLAYWCIPQLFFYGLYTLLGQVLNARSVFGPYMWAPALNNVIAIIGLVAFLVVFGGLPDGGLPPSAWTADRIMLLAGTATLGVVAQALVLLVPLHRSGFRFRPVWGIRGHGLGTASTVAVWAFAALAVGQLGYLAVSNLAAAASAAAEDTGQTVAGNFAYDNAFLIFMLPQSLVTVSLVTALFTRVAHNAALRDGAKVRDDLSLGLRTLGIVTVFATVAFAVLAIPLVQVVVLDGSTFAAYRAVGAVLVAMSFGLVAIAVWTMVQRIFYAYEDTRTLFRIQVPMAAILVVGCALSWWLLEPQWWVVGAGVATTLSNTIGATVGYLATRKYLPSLDGSRVLRTHLRVLLAAVPTGLAGWGALHLWGVQTSLIGALLRVVVVGGLMLVAYLVLIRALRVSELDGLAARIGGPLRRLRGRLGGGAPTAPRTMADPGNVVGAGVDVSTEVSLRAGELLASRYRLDAELATTGPGATWMATDTALDQPVRVLLVDASRRELTVDAARRAALIEDPRLPRVLRVGVESGQGFVVGDDHGPGVTLADLLADGPLPGSQARALVGEAAAALETARRRGVHHLALRPAALVRTDGGKVRLTGLATDAAQRGIELRDARAAGRRDAVGLVHLLYAALTGTWPGDPELADGLPLATRHEEQVVPAGDAVENVPNDLDTLCAVTLGEHDDGPFTPGELVADLAPWGAIDVTPVRSALPPTVRPAPAGAGPEQDDAAAATGVDTSGWAPHPLPATSEPTPFADLVTDTGTITAIRPPVHAAGAPRPARLSASVAGAAGAAGVVAGSAAAAASPVVAPTDHPQLEDDADAVEVGAPDAVEPSGSDEATGLDEATELDEAAAADEAADAEQPAERKTGDEPESGAAAAAVESEVAPESQAERASELETETATEDPLEHGSPEATMIGLAGTGVAGAGVAGAALASPGSPADPTQADPEQQPGTATDAQAAHEAEDADVGGLPSLATAPRGWDVPGGALPEPLAASPAMRTEAPAEPEETPDPEPAPGAGVAVVGATVATAAQGLRSTNTRINQVSGRVGGGARRLVGDAGERIGSITGRAGAFVDDVREEFRPVDEDEDGGRRFNPAPIALCVMVALVIFALVLAVMTLRDASTAFTPGPDPGEVPPAATPTDAEPEPEPSAEPTQEPTESEGLPAADTVEIADGITFDPTVDGGENQSEAYLAYDGNPDTTWNSLRYNSPTYGMKDGLGFTVELADAALVSSVTLDVNGEGGEVEIRLGDADDPSSGTVLAGGAMGSDVTYTFDEPVEAEAISLWFPELPVADSDGRNRIELAEISLG